MTRLWSEGQVIAVAGRSRSDGSEEPAAFTWRGQTHRVQEIIRRWRVDLEWWRVRIWRTYFKLNTDTGLLVVIYQDLPSGAWYLQRMYD
jgi:hypothetical protein